MPIITCSKVSKTYRANGRLIHALEDVSFSADQNELAICRGLAKATLFAHTNPDAAQAILAKLAPAEYVDPKFGRLFLDTVLDLTKSPEADFSKGEFGRNYKEAWEAYQDFLITGKKAAEGGLEKPQDLDRFLNNELVPQCNSYDKEKVRKMAREWKM